MKAITTDAITTDTVTHFICLLKSIDISFSVSLIQMIHRPICLTNSIDISFSASLIQMIHRPICLINSNDLSIYIGLPCSQYLSVWLMVGC